MKKIITEYYCDICDDKTDNQEENIMVVFETEQNEGLSCYPYLQNNKIVLCNNCKNKILFDGQQIFAVGAMGFNKYYFKEKSDK